MAGLNVLTWLTAYLDKCGHNGGKPLTGPALERFLPWNASREDLRTWAQPPPPDKPRTNNAPPAWPPRTATPTIRMPSHRTSEYFERPS